MFEVETGSKTLILQTLEKLFEVTILPIPKLQILVILVLRLITYADRYVVCFLQQRRILLLHFILLSVMQEVFSVDIETSSLM